MSKLSILLENNFSRYILACNEGFYEIYDFIECDELRRVLGGFHGELNKFFKVMNSDIRYEFDKNGNKIYKGGYFHAQDSRELITIINDLKSLYSELYTTEYSFEIKNLEYKLRIEQCEKFLENSGGSSIPDYVEIIDIVIFSCIFKLNESIEVSTMKRQNLNLIREGSYAKVYSYIDEIYNEKIAVKRARRNLTKKELERFKIEYLTLKKLNSPYIIKVFSYNEAKNEYTMECLDENIDRFIRNRNYQLSINERKNIIFQICKGLKYVYTKNILHRDISTTNIFVKHYEDVDVIKIGDFGLVKLPESNLTSLKTTFKGSLNDPSLVNVGFSNYSMGHEIFALTRLFYFIMTGRMDISNESNNNLIQFWNKGTNPDISMRYSSIDEMIDAIRLLK